MSLINAIFLGVLNALLCPLIYADSESGPTLRFYPTPPPINGTDNSLIWFKHADESNIKEWVSKLADFLAVYKDPSLTPGRKENLVDCSYSQPAPKGKVCHIDATSFQPCTEENHFHYHQGHPCVFLEMKGPSNWMPEYYNNSKDLPTDMPAELKSYIAEIEQVDKNRLNTIWITCQGSSPVDQENIGPVQYSDRGFPGYFFHSEKPEGYLNPLIALNFERPIMGVIFSVECKLWARNIAHDPKTKAGLIEFELLID